MPQFNTGVSFSNNVFINKTIATTPVKTIEVDEDHMEAKDYICANPYAIYGSAPRTTTECLEKFFPGYTQNQEIKELVAKLRPSKKITTSGSGPPDYVEIPEPGCSLDFAFSAAKACDLIEYHLGKSFFGCFYADPNFPFSCNCPSIGKDFPKLLAATIKTASFWNTPLETPLVRRAFLSILNSTKIQVTIDGTFDLKPGYKVLINDPPDVNGIKEGKMQGFWIIQNMSHKIFKDRHMETTLTLVRAYNDENAPFTNTKDVNIEALINIEV